MLTVAYIGRPHRYEPRCSGAVGATLCHQTRAPFSEGCWGEGGVRRLGDVHGEITSLGITRGGDTGERECRSERYISKAARV